MFKLPEFPSVDFSKFDVNALRNLDLNKFVPNVDGSPIDVDKFGAAVRDAGYLVVGFGVLAVEKAKSISADLVESITEGFATSKTQFETLLSNVEPGALVDQARDFGKNARQQVCDLIGSAA